MVEKTCIPVGICFPAGSQQYLSLTVKVVLRPRYNRYLCCNVCFQGLTDVPSEDATSQATVALAWVALRRQSQTRIDFGS